jgi:hypothetical protein
LFALFAFAIQAERNIIRIGPRSNILITFDFVIQIQAIGDGTCGRRLIAWASFFAFMRASAAIVA